MAPVSSLCVLVIRFAKRRFFAGDFKTAVFLTAVDIVLMVEMFKFRAAATRYRKRTIMFRFE